MPAAGCCVHVGSCVPLPSVALQVEIVQDTGANRCQGEANHCHLHTIVQLAVYRRRYELADRPATAVETHKNVL